MTIYRLEIDGDEDAESIAVSLALFASSVFDEQFPGKDERWREAMTTLVRVVNEHVRESEQEA